MNNQDFDKEALLLKKYLYSDILEVFQKNHVYVAGGAITSVFSGTKINDYDVYFKDKESRDAVLEFFNDKSNGVTKVCSSVNAATYNTPLATIQLILRDEYISKTTEELVNKFDFTVCQAGFCFQQDEFYLAPRFLQDLSGKKLVFNLTCMNPLSSLWRTYKYVNRGYSIESTEVIKIAFVIAEHLKDVNNYADLKKMLDSFSPTQYKHLLNYLKSMEDTKFGTNSFLTLMDTFNIIDNINKHNCGY